MPSRKLHAEATFRKHGGQKAGGSEARIPSDVRDFFGAAAGDTLVFEDGCAETVEGAALRGRYAVVRMEARPTPPPPAVRVVKPAPPESQPARAEDAPPSGSSFAEEVRRQYGRAGNPEGR
jgi:hypothetical protein